MAEIVTKLLKLLDDLIDDARKVSLSTNPDTELGRFDCGVFWKNSRTPQRLRPCPT